MEHRGRKSVAELSVISGDGIVTIRRPEPPAGLTEQQAAEWTAVVNRLPADWFPRETHAMLAQYCRHVVDAKRISMLIEQVCARENLEIEAYNRLLRMQESETRAIQALLRSMRLTQQATISAHKRKPRVKLPKPWESPRA